MERRGQIGAVALSPTVFKELILIVNTNVFIIRVFRNKKTLKA